MEVTTTAHRGAACAHATASDRAFRPSCTPGNDCRVARLGGRIGNRARSSFE